MAEYIKESGYGKDVDDIRAKVFARQEAEKLDEFDLECVDIASNTRGRKIGSAPEGCDYTMTELADHIGLGDSKFPAQAVSKIIKKAKSKFTKNFYLMTLISTCIRQGFDADDAIHLAKTSWDIEIQSGKTEVDLFEEVCNG